MRSELLIYPLLAHIIWVVFLYALLTICRAPAVWNIGSGKINDNTWKRFETKVSANLSNQFEWPIFFYVICVLFMSSDQSISSLAIVASWVFVCGRLLHSGVQILTDNIRLRGAVFTINFLAVVLMWLLYAVENA